MASLNVQSKLKNTRTYEGASVVKVTELQELERAILTCFLWENSFYEKGSVLAERIGSLVPKIKTENLHFLVLSARSDMNLRHAPLFLLVEMLKCGNHKNGLAALISQTIQRPDDATELLSLYWRDGQKPIPNQMKRGIALSLSKFSEFQLARYMNKGAIKLVDLFNLVHPKPKDKTQEKLWTKFVSGKLEAPDTWEVRLSAEGNKREIWEEFLRGNKLGGMALLRNLRNMIEKGVDINLIAVAIRNMKADRILPFRFIAAARYAPSLESVIEQKMLENVKEWGTLKGRTLLLVDVSGSMDSKLSEKSDMTNLEAANALAIMLREVCEEVQIFTFSNQVIEIPNRRGFALRDAVVGSQPHGGTDMGQAVAMLNAIKADRMIVFTDEQSSTSVPDPLIARSYIINVSGYAKSVSTKNWITISGFSERVVDYIQMIESTTINGKS